MSYLYHFIAILPQGTECLKVGKGASPKQRMRGYAQEYSLGYRRETLRQFAMPSHRIARVFETEVHDRLEAAGHKRVEHRSAQELFSLAGTPLDDMEDWIAATLDQFSAELAEFLVGDVDRFRSSLRIQREAVKPRSREQRDKIERIRRTADAPPPSLAAPRDAVELIRRRVEVPQIQCCRSNDTIEKLVRDTPVPNFHRKADSKLRG